MQNAKRRKLVVAFCILHFAFCISVLANDLSVDRRSLRAGETLTITVSLENDFASTDTLKIPLRNLTIAGAPSVSSEFSWINGEVVRRKVFRYRARPNGPGPAQAGPLVIRSDDGQQETLPAIVVQVVADRAMSSNDPEVVLRELLATSRDPFFIVSDLDRASAYVGEQVVVTWWLYNATSVQQWGIGEIPKLDGFWVEELDVRSEQPVQVFVGGVSMQRMPIRRVALYPLRSGTLDIGSMEVEAAVLRRSSSSPFGLFEGSLTEISFASAALTVEARALPPGSGVDATGDLTLRCTKPKQEAGGPVVLDAILSGRGNLRAASAPKFAAAIDGDVEVSDSGVAIAKTDESPMVTRRWKYLIFPRTSGTLKIAPLALRAFIPSDETRRTLQCESSMLVVNAARPESQPATAATRSITRTQALTKNAPWIAAGILALLTIALALRPLRRARRIARDAKALTRGRSPHEIREAVQAALEAKGIDPGALLRESSNRGEAWRSLRSLLDALEKDRIELDDREHEIRTRVKDLLRES
ncbi:MAG: BatD family protein [Thermoanaerobaculia bacterium]|nr:BatD family protein [Thermoanaerobaculia bacterium]